MMYKLVCALALFREVKPYEDGLVEDDDGFVLIERHRDVANGYFSSNVRSTGLENEEDPSANTYCIIGGLDTSDYLQSDGNYDLKLIYKYSDGTEDVLEWSQSSWITESSVVGADLSNIVDAHSHVDDTRFRGLARSSWWETYLDGNGADLVNWWHAVASVNAHGGGIPAHEGKIAYSSSLWIRPAESTTAEPTTAEPTTAEPTTAEPTTAEPTTAEPTSPTVYPSAEPTADPARDCDVLHIDEFLVDCSVEFESHDNDIDSLKSDVTTIKDDVANGEASIVALEGTVDNLVNSTSAMDAAIQELEYILSQAKAGHDALEAVVNELVNSSSAADESIDEIKADIQIIMEQLEKIGDLPAAASVIGGNMDWYQQSAGDSMVQLNGTNMVIAGLVIANVVTMIVLAVVCCCNGSSSDKHRYGAVEVGSD